MTDDERPWLKDDLLVSLLAASTVAIVLTTCIWNHIHPNNPQQQQQPPEQPAEPKERKSTRSKDRRRRGKDPFRDLFKGGKKSKALLRAIKTPDHDHTHPSVAPPNDTASSRSPSPELPVDPLDMHPHPDTESDNGSATSLTPNGNSSISTGDVSDQDAFSQTDGIRTHSAHLDPITVPVTEANASSVSTIMDTSSPPVPTACGDTRTPPPRNSQAVPTSGSCAKLVRARTRLRLSRMDPSVKSSLLSSTPSPLPDNVATPLNSIPSIAPCPSLSEIPSTHSNDAGPSTPTNSWELASPSPSSMDSGQSEPATTRLDEGAQVQLETMRSALEAARFREEQLRVEAQQASKERDELRWGWNEDAGVWRRREAELQTQIHHLMQQLQAYAAVATFQAHQASSGFSSPTSPHAHSSPHLAHHPLAPFPLPPPIQAQNSASAPAHVQALLASAPMLTSHPPGFAVPSGGLYSGAGLGMSPLLWSGLGLCVPNRDARHGGRRTPDSLGSGSSSRGRRRRRHAEDAKNISDESSLGDEDGSGDEDTWAEDIFRNNVLADAILKRPESIRELSGSVGKRAGRVASGGRPTMHGMGGVGEGMDAPKDPALEKPSFVPPLVGTPTQQ